MSTSEAEHRLCWYGVLLFLLGLLTGVLVPAFTNSRMGLSAHMAGVQNGMVLAILGLLWPKVSLSEAQARWTATLAVFSMYAIWLALALAAAFGTSRTTPIAGAGFQGAPWQEWSVAALLYPGSIGILACAALVLYGLRRTRAT
jgi:hydroxylaminobenzene mutase